MDKKNESPTDEAVSSDKGVAHGIQPIRGEFTRNIGGVMENTPSLHDALLYLRYSSRRNWVGGKNHLIDGSSLRSLPVMVPDMVDLWRSSLKEEVEPVPDYRFIINPHSVDLEKHSKEINTMTTMNEFEYGSFKERMIQQGVMNPDGSRKSSKHRQRKNDLFPFHEKGVDWLNPWDSPTGSRVQMFHTYQVPLQWRIKQMSAREFLDFVTHPATMIECHHGGVLHMHPGMNFQHMREGIRQLNMMKEPLSDNHPLVKLQLKNELVRLRLRNEFVFPKHELKQEKHYFALHPSKQEK